MKTKLNKTILTVILLLASSTAFAHFPWLLVGDPYPKKSKEAKVYAAWGHYFPVHGFMDKERISNLVMVTPDGKETALDMNKDVEFVTQVPTEPGVHVVLGNQGKGYYTKTRKGGERAPKTGLKDVVRCYYSDNSMKAVFNSGDKGSLSNAFGQSLEIIPQSNPAELNVGDYMPVKVLYRGSPYDGTVYSTYEGFSTEGAYAYTIDTDDNGIANIRLLDRGRWLVYARVENDYPDPKVCDVEAFTSTLTFSIR